MTCAPNSAQGFHGRIEHARERFLSPEELTRLAAVLDAAEDQRAVAIIRMGMLTGARVGEVRTARFEQFNLDFAIWSKFASTTKQRKTHRVPISQDVAAIVRLRQQVVSYCGACRPAALEYAGVSIRTR
ncbi:Phage integrase family protein [Paracoccus denitrificans]|jgi:integrase|uniref:Phage integrase n=1 Tax=Paracoccus denitrificans (strain Pd 1222) TaxID=318586 RepID=A1B6R7_PARDP|nr:phage integrase [Paracoccus denitrificans PD1222]MBB4628186.1 integrase [Paracoccus denitrificans]GEK71311.1 hypothetical protein PDE01_48310 [Paracoccus denitrificans]SDI90857.1 Phage integrase family protein [Paracoccus denitrificans]SFR09609.1 Phage integrase family protein [Paracoccus denitrificans]